jgi:type IV pilus assembly protein PilM
MLGLGEKNSFGIDIGTQTIKISEVRKQGSKISVINYSIWNDDLDNIIQEKNGEHTISVNQITSIIRAMLNAAQMEIKEAYIAIPSYLAFSAVVQFPIMSFEELSTAVPLEAKQHIPVPLNNVQLDWMNLGLNKEKNKSNILLIAIPNGVVNTYIEVSKALGIAIKGFELDAFSIIRSIDLPDSQVCIVDLGARTSTVSIVSAEDQLQLIQSFNFGGNHITDNISTSHNMSSIEAEKIKKDNGISGLNSDISALIQSSIKSFFENDVLRIIKQFQDNNEEKIQEIVLIGGFSKMDGIREFIDLIISNQLGSSQKINITIAEPYSNLTIKGVKDKEVFHAIWHDLVLSIGIALKDYVK